MQENLALRALSLSHNNFREKGGEILGSGIGNTAFRFCLSFTLLQLFVVATSRTHCVPSLILTMSRIVGLRKEKWVLSIKSARCVCVCVCVRACVRACVRVCVCVCSEEPHPAEAKPGLEPSEDGGSSGHRQKSGGECIVITAHFIPLVWWWVYRYHCSLHTFTTAHFIPLVWW